MKGESANHLGLHGSEESQLDYERGKLAGQHAAFGIARRYLRLAKSLSKTLRSSFVHHPPLVSNLFENPSPTDTLPYGLKKYREKLLDLSWIPVKKWPSRNARPRSCPAERDRNVGVLRQNRC